MFNDFQVISDPHGTFAMGQADAMASPSLLSLSVYNLVVHSKICYLKSSVTVRNSVCNDPNVALRIGSKTYLKLP